ncbi:hypothetical protein [Nesterenkonia sp. NBAIMH1]|uniref:hypothetical protein n=1 Tax=Nesterenkonia sp. NBAIMH1 TaxID=2600320 RepID=UPI0011B55DF6|nr:hypothetical protein [Nesterenkonia sp. NBAIMH1]
MLALMWWFTVAASLGTLTVYGLLKAFGSLVERSQGSSNQVRAAAIWLPALIVVAVVMILVGIIALSVLS